MAEFVQLLGWLLLGLTFIGSFRLARSLNRSTTRVYPLLIAATLTTIFIITADTIFLLSGILAVTLPIALVIRRLTRSTTEEKAQSQQRPADTVHDTHPVPTTEQDPVVDHSHHDTADPPSEPAKQDDNSHRPRDYLPDWADTEIDPDQEQEWDAELIDIVELDTDDERDRDDHA